MEKGGEEVEVFGMMIYEKEESVKARRDQLEKMLVVFKEKGVEVRYKTPADGNCFFHGFGEQVGVGHEEVRKEAIRFLRENEVVGGEDWAYFVDEEEDRRVEQGKRRSNEERESARQRRCRKYLRKMARHGEWVDHLMVVATANAYRRKVVIFSQAGVTVVEPVSEEGEEVFGARHGRTLLWCEETRRYRNVEQRCGR